MYIVCVFPADDRELTSSKWSLSRDYWLVWPHQACMHIYVYTLYMYMYNIYMYIYMRITKTLKVVNSPQAYIVQVVHNVYFKCLSDKM